jgi:predicted nucleic acid-binding protein
MPLTDDFEVTGHGDAAAWRRSAWLPLKRVGGSLSYPTRAKLLYSRTGIYVLVDCVDRRLTCTRLRDMGDLYREDVVWHEFVCGPVTPGQIAPIRSLLVEVAPFDEAQAQEAARLFNACGRKRHLRVDAMIAAAAITRRASLATGNTEDFRVFSDSGLMFAEAL